MGWYDAGDYNKYIVNSGITVYAAGRVRAPPRTTSSALANIPRAQPTVQRGLPDLLSRCSGTLDWMLTMRDPDDGGVYPSR